MNFLLGADPELFVTNGRSFVSAHDLLPGTKSEPFKVPRGAVQVDGTAAEFNIDPTKNANEFVRNIKTVQSQLNKIIRTKDKSLRVIAEPVADYDPAYFESIPPESRVLGCDPDFNAWNDGLANPIPDNNATFRTGSGHVHVGWTEGAPVTDPDYIKFCCKIVKMLDVYLGIPSLLWDKNQKRRELYGRAGAFRPKHYGLEYRVLSNAWLREEKLMRWVFKTTQLALNNELNATHPYSYHLILPYAEMTINNGDELSDTIRVFLNELPPLEGYF